MITVIIDLFTNVTQYQQFLVIIFQINKKTPWSIVQFTMMLNLVKFHNNPCIANSEKYGTPNLQRNHCPLGIHFFVKISKLGSHVFMSWQQIPMKVSIFTKFGTINQEVRFILCLSEKIGKQGSKKT